MSTTAAQQTLQDVFDQLIEANLDSHAGFKTAAYAIDDPSLRAELIAQSQEHARFAQDLKDLTSILNLLPGSAQKKTIPPLMRGWVSLRHAIATHDRYAILAECELSLAKTIACYRGILNAELPHWVAYFLTVQAVQIEQSHDRISRMCALALSLLPPHRPAPAAFTCVAGAVNTAAC